MDVRPARAIAVKTAQKTHDLRAYNTARNEPPPTLVRVVANRPRATFRSETLRAEMHKALVVSENRYQWLELGDHVLNPISFERRRLRGVTAARGSSQPSSHRAQARRLRHGARRQASAPIAARHREQPRSTLRGICDREWAGVRT